MPARSTCPNFPSEIGLPDYHDPVYDPLWGVLQETGISISHHLGNRHWLYDICRRDPTPQAAIFTSMPALALSEVIAWWILTGTLERFPGLKIVFVEPSLYWVPGFLASLDRKTGTVYDLPGVRLKPSEYFRRNMALTFMDDEVGLGLRHMIGIENILWSTDFPHPATTWPNSQADRRPASSPTSPTTSATSSATATRRASTAWREHADVLAAPRRRPTSALGRRRHPGRGCCDAVVECILENGYYEASSNAIARQAGVTWGAIQHQFGTRQALLLAVLEDRWQRLTDRIEAAEVSGDTLEERLACVMAALEAHYGDPNTWCSSQIMLDLIQSPATSEATKQRRRRPRAGAHPGLAAAVQPRRSGEAASDETLVRLRLLDHPRLPQRQHHGRGPRPRSAPTRPSAPCCYGESPVRSVSEPPRPAWRSVTACDHHRRLGRATVAGDGRGEG